MNLVDVADAFFPFSWWRKRWMPCRVVIACIQFGVLSLIPAALVAGSGGQGDGFEPLTFGAIVGGAVIVGGVIAGVTAPAARRRRGDQEQKPGGRG